MASHALHPGVVNSGLYQHLPGIVQAIERPIAALFFFTAAQGAWSSLYAVASSDTEADRGAYYSNCTKTWLAPHATDDTTAAALWRATVELIRSKGFDISAATAGESK